ncbi:MAG: sulfotransferase [Nocardioidaceae bacterium]|nr:sulfotransferase [Nocardioidaceae bacterium]
MTRHLLVIGAQRCGTTLLHSLLDSHPDITMARPARPEPKVFLSDELAARGIDWYRHTYFSHATSEHVLGEKSTSYLEHAEAAPRAMQMLGDADVVVQLRDPVARAVSNWRFSTKHGVEERPLVQALEENLDGPREWDPAMTSVSPYAYLERGRYVDYLQPWRACFPGRVQVLFLDEVARRPSSLSQLCAGLGVDPGEAPSQPTDLVNQSEGMPPHLPSELVDRLRAYFDDGDARLRDQLGRDLPWDRHDDAPRRDAKSETGHRVSGAST